MFANDPAGMTRICLGIAKKCSMMEKKVEEVKELQSYEYTPLVKIQKKVPVLVHPFLSDSSSWCTLGR